MSKFVQARQPDTPRLLFHYTKPDNIISTSGSILITLKDVFPEHHYLIISLATLKPADLKAQEKLSIVGISKASILQIQKRLFV